jgi:primase-polymerase (primpol)-like protein
MLTSSDTLCGIDLDKCRDPQSGHITEWARHIIVSLNSYTEISPSGTGIHIIIHASMLTTIEKLGRTKLAHKRGHIEIYDERRYFTWSGNLLEGTPTTIEERQDELTDLYQRIFPEEEKHVERAQEAPASLFSSLSDEWILSRARLMRGGNGAKFERLWRGDASDYRRPDGSIDHSRADQALLGILAYWTGRDAARMEYLFTRSGLYRKDRWNETARSGETYGQGSIRLAIRNCQAVYNPEWAEAHRYQPNKKQLPKTGVFANNREGGK